MRPPSAKTRVGCDSLGTGLGDKFEVSQGGSRTRQWAGKACWKPLLLQPVAAARILHGKEGVDGSSPSEGFEKSAANGPFCCLLRRRAGVSRGYETGTFSDQRARAGMRGLT